MNKDQIKKVEDEAERLYLESGLGLTKRRYFIKGAQFALSMGSEWVKVETGYPEDLKYVLAYEPEFGDVYSLFRENGKWMLKNEDGECNEFTMYISMWQHIKLPTPPVE